MDIRGQDQAYKRGLVLGLTMAEIIILVLFCLLLALAAVFAAHRDRIEKQSVTISNQAARIAALEDAVQVEPEVLRVVSVLKEYWERYAPEGEEFQQYFSQLVLRVENLERLRSDMEQLVERNRALQQQADNAGRLRMELDEKRTELEVAAQLQRMLRRAGIYAGTMEGRERLQEAFTLLAKSETEGQGEHDWPPIITLSEADDYHFHVGSAELSRSFRQLLTSEVVPRVLQIISDYDVNVVEVIGHTDEQPIATRTSNLDGGLRRVLEDGAPISELIPADNAGLGLARAVSVARVLSSDTRLSMYTVLALSGGQLIDGDQMTNWTDSGDVPARRRIEIRLRRSSERLGKEVRAGTR